MRVNIDLAVSLVKNETWSLFILGNPILTQSNINKVPLGPPIGLKRKLDIPTVLAGSQYSVEENLGGKHFTHL